MRKNIFQGALYLLRNKINTMEIEMSLLEPTLIRHYITVTKNISVNAFIYDLTSRFLE